MDIQDTRKCNVWNLGALSQYLGVPKDVLIEYYNELLGDERLLSELNLKLMRVRTDHGFYKGIFKRESVSSADWFAFERVLIYVLIRYLKPSQCLETGVYYGGNTAFMLAALAKNKAGELISIDLPDLLIRQDGGVERHPMVGDSELYQDSLSPGFIVPDYLREWWTFIQGDSHQVIPKLNGPFEFYIHDSEHSFGFVSKEMGLVRPKLTPSAMVVVDDIDWSNGFFSFCVKERLHPLLLTDNGKDNLRVRIGVAKLDHANNRISEITGAA